MSAHASLRLATAAAHDRVDSAFARFDIAKRSEYGRFLQCHAAAFLPAEAALTRAGAAGLIADWGAYLRSPALAADLADLDLAPVKPRDPPRYDNPAAVFGGAYVLEGSRLGGALLRRQVGSGLPRRFLDSIQPPGRWKRFIAQLESNLYDSAAMESATSAALQTFALFESVELGHAR